MRGGIELSVANDLQTNQGTVSGTGSLSFEISDATQGNFRIDYESPDAVTLHIGTKTGLKIGHRDLSVQLSGKMLMPKHEISGGAEVALRISKEVAASIRHAVSDKGGRTVLTVTVDF